MLLTSLDEGGFGRGYACVRVLLNYSHLLVSWHPEPVAVGCALGHLCLNLLLTGLGPLAPDVNTHTQQHNQ